MAKQCKKNQDTQFPAWDLKDLYCGIKDKQISKDLDFIKQSNQKLEKMYKGKLATLSNKQMLQAILLIEEISKIESKLSCYSYLYMTTQMNNKEAVSFYQNISEKLNEYSKPSIFFSLEFNQLSQDAYKKLLQDEQLKKYQPFMDRIRLFKKYELSQEQEEIFHEKSVTSRDAWIRLYDETSAHLKFKVGGKEYNDAQIGKLLQDKSASTREKAGKELNRVMQENARLYSFIYNMIVKDRAISTQKRGFKTPVASQNLRNRVDDKALEALTSTVVKNYKDIAHRFYKLKAKWLGVKKIQYWDRNAPLPFCSDKKYSWTQAVSLVLDSYEEFSPKLKSLADGFFENNWIDVPPREGKRSGAFAMSINQDIHPYLMLNFVGKQNDVLTLAHELGHGCHMRLSCSQGDLNDATPLTLAEVASVFGEMITFQNMLKNTTDKKAKLCLIAGKVNDMINTAVRQIAFHLFETQVHQERQQGEVSQERLCQIWLEQMQKSLGPWVNVDENSKYIWAQVSHFFHVPFYVYAYSFADCLVNSLFKVYRSGKIKDFDEKYLKMLSLTGVKSYKDILKPFGLDANSETFWQYGLDLIKEYISELEKLDKEVFKK